MCHDKIWQNKNNNKQTKKNPEAPPRIPGRGCLVFKVPGLRIASCLLWGAAFFPRPGLPCLHQAPCTQSQKHIISMSHVRSCKSGESSEALIKDQDVREGAACGKCQKRSLRTRINDLLLPDWFTVNFCSISGNLKECQELSTKHPRRQLQNPSKAWLATACRQGPREATRIWGSNRPVASLLLSVGLGKSWSPLSPLFPRL